MSEPSETPTSDCPVCNRVFKITELEKHVNKCLFLNSETDEEQQQQKRKRSASPVFHNAFPKLNSKQKSPSRNITSAETSSSANKNNNVVVMPTKSQTDTCDLSFVTPLAKQVQPKRLEDFYGQSHVLGKHSVLRTLIERGEIPNMILWGPPGCGKTSLSRIIQEMCKTKGKKFKFCSLCAATCGVKDVQNIITAAKLEMKFGRRTILFMDEIHRFNKKQQDTFLLSVERGDITLIGATTENPSFSMNNALLSRCRVIVLEKLTPEDLNAILELAAEKFSVEIIDDDNPCVVNGDNFGVCIKRSALQWLADISDGDARIALNNFQMVIQHYNNCTDKIITVDDIKEGIKKSHLLYDKKGEEHYNIISAMHKSIRGSDVNAALYWTTRMIVSGEDPLFIARRLVRAASEDIGNADPKALQLAVSTMQGCQLLGMPEADCLLAQCAIYLARAPKSREADAALARAKQTVLQCKGVQPAVPMHIRNAPTKLMKEMGYGKLKAGENWGFMPPELEDVDFFN